MNGSSKRARFLRAFGWTAPPVLSVCLFVSFNFIDWEFWRRIMASYMCIVRTGSLRTFRDFEAWSAVVLPSASGPVTPRCLYADLLLAAAPFVVWGGSFLRSLLRLCVFVIVVASLDGVRILLVQVRGYWGLPWWVAHDIVNYTFWAIAMGFAIWGWVTRVRKQSPRSA